MTNRAFKHLRHGLSAHGREAVKNRLRNIQHLVLRLIGISHEASFEPFARAGNRRERRTDHAAGKGFGGNHDLTGTDNAAAEFFDFIFYFFIHCKIQMGEAAP